MKTFLLLGVLAFVGLAVRADPVRIFTKTEEGLVVKPEPHEETEDTEGAFQSDMLLTPEQKAELMKLIEEEDKGGELGKRRVTAFLYKRWPKNTLMYEFHPSSVPDRTEIMKGLELWTKYTCVKIVPYSPSMATSLGHQNRILFFKGSGCSSYVGMSGTAAQRLNIGEGCANPGTVAHEVGHALGWHHEQSRPDRDDHVIVNYDNVKAGAEINFAKYSASQIATHEVPYDVESIMHYGSGYFSKNGKPTIEARNQFDEFLMGNRADFSFYDKKLANLMFDCDKDCTNNPQCLNEGFVDKDCKCVCKPGYIGNRCQTYDAKEAGCSAQHLTESTGTLTSPNYPDNYKNGQTCVWLIEGGQGSTITLKFKQFEVETDSYCGYDKVTVRSGSNMNSGGNSYCGYGNPRDITSTGNQMLVAFTSDFSKDGSGFEAEYTIHGDTIDPSAPTTEPPKKIVPTLAPVDKCENPIGSCGGTFEGSGCVASPNYGEGGNYNNRQDCLYNIQVPKGQRVELNLLSLDVEQGSNCAWDRLEIDLGLGTIGMLKLCGDGRPTGSFVSMSNYMSLRLVSDESISARGFAAKFTAVRLDH